MKTYYFTDDSYWDSPGCSCCEPCLMECYNCENTDPNMGSASSEDGCYVQAIVTELGGYHIVPQELLDELYEKDYNDLKQMADDLGIEVRIEE